MKTVTYDETKWRLVPVDLAARVQDSLGRFTSDEGFGQEDVDTADDFAAALSVAPTPPGAADAASDGSLVISEAGCKLIAQAMAAHGAVVQYIVLGRYDLALAESSKWANGIHDAAMAAGGE